jgi:hypothetical protein
MDGRKIPTLAQTARMGHPAIFVALLDRQSLDPDLYWESNNDPWIVLRLFDRETNANFNPFANYRYLAQRFPLDKITDCHRIIGAISLMPNDNGFMHG